MVKPIVGVERADKRKRMDERKVEVEGTFKEEIGEMKVDMWKEWDMKNWKREQMPMKQKVEGKRGRGSPKL